MSHAPLLLALACASAGASASHATPQKKSAAKKEAVHKQHAAAHKKPAGAKSSRPGKAGKAVAKAAAPKPAAARVDYAGEQVNFGEWKAVNDFADDMASKHGFDREELKALIGQLRYVDSAVQLVKPAPPGKPKNWHAYRDLFIEPVRVEAGVAE